MTTRPPCVLLSAREPSLLVCAAFFVHCLGVGFYPDGMELWSQNNQLLTWTAAALTMVTALATPVLGLLTQRPGGDR